MNYKLAATNINAPIRFLSYGSILLFASSIILIAIIIFYKNSLLETVLTISYPDKVTQYYLEQLVVAYPKQSAIRAALVRQEIGFSDWKKAEEGISILAKEPDMEVETRLLQTQLKFAQAYQSPLMVDRKPIFANLRNELATFSHLPLTKEQVLSLASMSLSVGMPALALSFYEKLGKITDPILLKSIAKTALETSQYEVSARYYMLAQQYENSLEEKRKDIIAALEALQGGKLFQQGLQIINNLNTNLIDNKAMLMFLVEYTLAANRPDLAEIYIKRALLK